MTADRPADGIAPGPLPLPLADWAASIAERFPDADIRVLARAAAGGPAGVHAARRLAASADLRRACDELAAWLADLHAGTPGQIAWLIAGAAQAAYRARQQQSLDVVWTGPEVASGAGRLTAATVIDLIGKARREILIVSYATQTEPAIEAALQAAVERGVEITLLTERHRDNPTYAATGEPFPGLRALRLHWPTDRRSPGAALHAKIIVVDDRIALVGSANITGRAMESNLECGIRLHGGPVPRSISDHITELQARGYLERAPSSGS
jgi:phosphatidylserine/phosphatidylglycerophosphate/cardiolipin synthase-like enzyme